MNKDTFSIPKIIPASFPNTLSNYVTRVRYASRGWESEQYHIINVSFKIIWFVSNIALTSWEMFATIATNVKNTVTEKEKLEFGFMNVAYIKI